MSPKKNTTRQMSPSHKQALAEGRSQGRAVRRYLDALEAHKPKRGRKRTPDSIKKRLDRIEVELHDAEPLQKLQLVQERLDLEHELTGLEDRIGIEELEEEFIEAAKSYSERKGISYAAWRSLGVSASTLRQAGISRSS